MTANLPKSLRVLTADELVGLPVFGAKSQPVAKSDAPDGTDWVCGSCGVVLFEKIGRGGIWIHAAIRCPACTALVSGDARDLN